MAIGGAVLDLVMEHRMEASMGVTAEPLHEGKAGRLMRAAKMLTVAGAAGSLLAGRSRVVAALSGAALLAGSACTRFGVFEAGQASAKDPKYTVVPQRGASTAASPSASTRLCPGTDRPRRELRVGCDSCRVLRSRESQGLPAAQHST